MNSIRPGMMRRKWTGIVCLLVLACVGHAAVMPRSPERMKKDATDVIIGTVQEVTRSVAVREEFGGKEETTVYVAQILVEQVEKGDAAKVGQHVYVKTWKHQWKGPGPKPPGNSGHWQIPRKDQRVRVYLESLKGRNHVLLQDGMQLIK